MNKDNAIATCSKTVMVALMLAVCMASQVVMAEELTPAMTAKVDKYKKTLAGWAASPVIVAAAKASNDKGGIAGMSNAKWDELSDNDPVVTDIKQNAASKQINQWESSTKDLDKLNLRDEKGNLAGFSPSSGKPLLYNNANRPPFQNGLKGVWAAKEIKPDPTTQKKTVQISAPVLEGGKAIGVLHSAVVAD